MKTMLYINIALNYYYAIMRNCNNNNVKLLSFALF